MIFIWNSANSYGSGKQELKAVGNMFTTIYTLAYAPNNLISIPYIFQYDEGMCETPLHLLFDLT